MYVTRATNSITLMIHQCLCNTRSTECKYHNNVRNMVWWQTAWCLCNKR